MAVVLVALPVVVLVLRAAVVDALAARAEEENAALDRLRRLADMAAVGGRLLRGRSGRRGSGRGVNRAGLLEGRLNGLLLNEDEDEDEDEEG